LIICQFISIDGPNGPAAIDQNSLDSKNIFIKRIYSERTNEYNSSIENQEKETR
jgi:hypothetical protein